MTGITLPIACASQAYPPTAGATRAHPPTSDGPGILTRFPGDELLVAGRRYVRGADLVDRETDTVSTK